MAASLLDDPATLRLLGRGPLHAGRRKASKLIPRATTGAAASRPRSVGMASAAIGGGIPTPIDVAPHTTWRAVAATLRLPSHTRTMGRRLTALSHTAAARVQQLDAVRLDTELLLILGFQLRRIALCFGTGALDAWKPEMDALLPALLYAFTVASNLPTPGMALQNLRFADQSSTRRISRLAGQRVAGGGAVARHTDDVVYGAPLPSVRQRLSLGAMTIGLRYAWGRLSAVAEERGWEQMGNPQAHTPGQRLRAAVIGWLRHLEKLVVVASCLHHLHFLATGSYRGIVERLLSMRLVQARPEGMQRLHMFEYMNRQLIWTGIADFGIFVMTVVDSGALWRWIRGVVQARRRPSAATMAAKRAIADDGKCPLCAASTGTAYALQGCAHEYCYYCLATACPALVLDDPADVPVQHRRQRTFRCVVCNHVAHKAARSRR